MGEWTTRLATAKLIGGHTGQEHTECSNKDENTPMIAARARACVCVCSPRLGLLHSLIDSQPRGREITSANAVKAEGRPFLPPA